MLQIAFVGGLTGRYVDFGTAQRAALKMLGARQQIEIDDETAATMVDRMRALPVHPEVAEALTRLSETPLRLVALTNSTADVAADQLSNAGIRDAFEGAFSADAVKALKPARAAYELAARECAVPLSDVRLVAAHAWDISGALAAGARAAFVARPGMVLSPVGPQPDVQGGDISEVVDRIIAVDNR
jgi:2-haloacid dehalogenase